MSLIPSNTDGPLGVSGGKSDGRDKGRRKAVVAVRMSCVRRVMVTVERDFVRHPLKVLEKIIFI